MLEITYTVPLELLTAPQLKGLLEAHRVSVWDVTEARELRELAKQHGIEGRRLRGTAAIEAKAKEMLGVSSRLDRTIQCEPNAELGLVLRQVNEWAIVVEAQPKLEVRVGDVISAVDGKSVLLERYEDMFAALRAAKQASRPYTLTFRRAPFHRGWLCKRSRRKSGSILSGVLGWRKRFFVLAYGALAYYDEDPKRGGTIKGQFSLSHHAIIATAPKQFMSGTDRDPGIVLSKGPNDRLVLKAARSPSDIHEWAALLHIAIAHANGGNDLLRTETRRRLETELLKRRTIRKQQCEHLTEQLEKIPSPPPPPPPVVTPPPHPHVVKPHRDAYFICSSSDDDDDDADDDDVESPAALEDAAVVI